MALQRSADEAALEAAPKETGTAANPPSEETHTNPLSAPQDTSKRETLKESVISGNARPSTTKQSTPIQVIDRKEIERLGIQELYEAVRTFSGVSIKDYGGIGGIKTVSIRSMGSQHTAVSYDGISISNAQNGQIDIGRFSLDNIEQISVTIGQTDDIFQSARMSASAGALNIKTASPHFDKIAPVNLTFQIKAASYGTVNPHLLYEQRLGKNWSLTAFGDWMHSQGDYPFTLTNGNLVTTEIRKNSDVNILRGEINLFGSIGRTGRIAIKGNYLDSERGLPGSVVLYNTDATERLWDKIAFGNISYDTDLGKKWKISAKLNYNYTWNRYTITDATYPDGKEDDRYTQTEYYGSIATEYAPSDFLRFTIAEDFFVNTLDATIPECPFPTRYTTLTALAVQYCTDRLIATASLVGTYLTERVRLGEAASDKAKLSPAVSLSYKLLKDRNFRIRASYKETFRTPTFNDLYYSRVGNTALKPEKASQYNLGLTWSGILWDGIADYSSFTLDGYFNQVKDKIVAIPTMFIWKMRNVGKVNIIGADLTATLRFTLPARMYIDLSGNYSYQYAVDISDPDAKNYKHQIPYTPRHSGNITFSWQNPWVNLGYVMSAVGERYALPQNTISNKISGYFDHTISLSHTFRIGQCRLRLQGEIKNLGDVNYEVIQYYPMPGRSYWLTIKFSY